MAGKSWWQEREAASYKASIVKKQRQVNVGTQLFFFIWCTTSARETSAWVFPPRLINLENCSHT